MRMWDSLDKLPLQTVESIVIETEGRLLAEDNSDIKRIRTIVEEYYNTRSKQIRDAMNEALERDNHQCKWQGCTEPAATAHHIFPRRDYPELDSVSEYMISYCDRHHVQWHYAHEEHRLNSLL